MFLVATSDTNTPLIVRAFSPTQSADLTEWQDSTGVVLSAINARGGFTTSPVYGDLSGTVKGISSNPALTPSANSSASVRGVNINATTGVTAFNLTGTLVGLQAVTSHNGSGTANNIFGASFFPQNQGGGTVTNLKGIGINAQTQTVISTTTNATGIDITNTVGPSGSSVGTFIGVNLISPQITAGAAVTNQTGILINNQGTGGASAPVTSYGIRILNQNSANTVFAIKSEGGQCLFQSGGTGIVPLTLQAANGQTANLLQFTDLNGVVQTAVAANGRDFILDTLTGTKIGTATTQKLGFFNSAPVVQQVGASAAGIAGIIDPAARAAIAAIQAALQPSGLGLITAPA